MDLKKQIEDESSDQGKNSDYVLISLQKIHLENSEPKVDHSIINFINIIIEAELDAAIKESNKIIYNGWSGKFLFMMT